MRTSHAEYGQVIHELNTYYDSFKGHKTVAKCIDGEWGGDSFVYVLNFLNSKGFTLNMTEIDNLVEAAVLKLKQETPVKIE